MKPWQKRIHGQDGIKSRNRQGHQSGRLETGSERSQAGESGKCDRILSPVMRFLEEALFFQDSFSNSKRSEDSSWRKSTVEKNCY